MTYMPQLSAQEGTNIILPINILLSNSRPSFQGQCGDKVIASSIDCKGTSQKTSKTIPVLEGIEVYRRAEKKQVFTYLQKGY